MILQVAISELFESLKEGRGRSASSRLHDLGKLQGAQTSPLVPGTAGNMQKQAFFQIQDFELVQFALMMDGLPGCFGSQWENLKFSGHAYLVLMKKAEGVYSLVLGEQRVLAPRCADLKRSRSKVGHNKA